MSQYSETECMYNNAILDQGHMTNYQNQALTLDLFPGDLRISVKGMLNDSMMDMEFCLIERLLATGRCRKCACVPSRVV
jgi:hypothetical protein